MGATYRKAIKWRDSIIFSEEIGNNIEKTNEYTSNWRLQDYKIIQLTRLLQNEIVIFPHLILMVNYFLKRW